MKRESAFSILASSSKKPRSLSYSKADEVYDNGLLNDSEELLDENDSQIVSESDESQNNNTDSNTDSDSDSQNSGNNDNVNGLRHVPIPVSNFNPSKDNISYGETSITAGLKHGESLVFQGQYYLTVQKGAVSIYGATLHAGSERYKVCASSITALPRLSSIPTKKKYLNKIIQNSESAFLDPGLFDTIIHLDSLHTGLEDIPNIFPKFRSIFGSRAHQGRSKRSFNTIYNADPSIRTFSSNELWNSIAMDVVSDFKSSSGPPVIVVSGPKNSGKSTFCRFLLNYAISYLGTDGVRFLDCDPGQPEFAPPGVLYLSKPKEYNFSSPFSHPNFDGVIKSHSLGYNSPKDVPLLYLACFNDLFNIYKSSQLNEKSLLIVNTPGWTKGYGLELLMEMMTQTEFSHSVFLGSNDVETYQDFSTRLDNVLKKNNYSPKRYAFEALLTESTGKPISHTSKSFNASDVRNLQTSSYLSYNRQNDTFRISKLLSLPSYHIPFVHSQTDDAAEPSITPDDSDEPSVNDTFTTMEPPQKLISPQSVLAQVHPQKLQTISFKTKSAGPLNVRESAKISAFGIMSSEGIDGSDFERCLENVIVSILAVDNDNFSQIDDLIWRVPANTKGLKAKSNTLYIPIINPSLTPSILQPKFSRCLGIAFLRKIDTSTGTVQLQSSLNTDDIDALETTNEKIVLIRGRIPAPFK